MRVLYYESFSIKNIMYSSPVKILLIADLGCIFSFIMVLVCLGLGLFDSYMGYALARYGFVDGFPLVFFCNIYDPLSFFICVSFGILNILFSITLLCVSITLFFVPIYALVCCLRQTRRANNIEYDEEEMLVDDGKNLY